MNGTHLTDEIEAKFLAINIEEIRSKLQSIGATCRMPMRDMRRATFENDFMKDGKDAFLRVRDEGDKVTMTYKQFDSASVDGAKEIEIEVSDFEKTIELLKQTGLPPKSIQESRRETWHLGETEIVIDEWPWLSPYIEIEGTSTEAVQSVAEQLGFDWNTAVFGDVMAAFRAEYPFLTKEQTIGQLPSVRFDDSLPGMLQD